MRQSSSYPTTCLATCHPRHGVSLPFTASIRFYYITPADCRVLAGQLPTLPVRVRLASSAAACGCLVSTSSVAHIQGKLLHHVQLGNLKIGHKQCENKKWPGKLWWQRKVYCNNNRHKRVSVHHPGDEQLTHKPSS